MTVSIYHTFSTQRRQIIKLIAEYRYIAKVVWFHNILPLQTILPLHNVTNYLKMFLLKANMIYSNLSEAAGIWRKDDAFTVWKTALYLGTQTGIKTAALGKRCKNFQSGITFSSSLTTSLKLQYETKHGSLFVCLFGWFYLSMFSCSHWYSKSYDTPLLFAFKHQSMLPTTVIHSTCNFFFNYILWFNQKLKGKSVGEIYGLYYQVTPAWL